MDEILRHELLRRIDEDSDERLRAWRDQLLTALKTHDVKHAGVRRTVMDFVKMIDEELVIRHSIRRRQKARR